MSGLLLPPQFRQLLRMQVDLNGDSDAMACSYLKIEENSHHQMLVTKQSKLYIIFILSHNDS